MRLATLFLLLATLLGTQAPWQVGLRSFGPIRYGMTLRQVGAVLGDSLLSLNSGLSEDCDYLAGSVTPPGTSLMVWDAVIVRVDVDTPGVYTRSGIQVGSTEAEVQQHHPGHIKMEEHPYEGPEGHYLVYEPSTPADTSFAIIFETDGQRVTRFRAGLHPAVALIEGCS
jgi:hypothetical protein